MIESRVFCYPCSLGALTNKWPHTKYVQEPLGFVCWELGNGLDWDLALGDSVWMDGGDGLSMVCGTERGSWTCLLGSPAHANDPCKSCDGDEVHDPPFSPQAIKPLSHGTSGICAFSPHARPPSFLPSTAALRVVTSLFARYALLEHVISRECKGRKGAVQRQIQPF